MNVVANIDLAQMDAKFADVERRAKALTPAFRELRKPMLADQRDHARKAEGDTGGWAARSPVTEARRRARNRRVRTTKAMRLISPNPTKKRSTPKRLLGRLPAAIITIVTSSSIRTRSRAAWSDAHQKGARVGHGRKVRLPRRTFLWLSDSLLSSAKVIFAKHLLQGWAQ